MKANVICVFIVASWFLEVRIAAVPLVDVDIWTDTVVGADTKNFSRLVNRRDFNRLPRVLNFFPVPFVEECKSNDGRRRGICMNTYECRIQEGKSHGSCALGFGVCCVFTATCSQEVFNNLTYFVNPNYPDLTTGMSSCQLKVKKIDPEVVQIRFDFIHFNLGQPNRTTGVCDKDKFSIKSTTPDREIILCGLNSGQHLYFDMSSLEEVELSLELSKKAVARFWEVVITQVTFEEQAPPGCLQYHTGSSGIVQTMNFADNGRHLADQDYNICIRQEEGFCSIAYEPCHENAFRIAPNSQEIDTNIAEEGSGDDTFEEFSRAIDLCNDKIVLPCHSEELLMMPEFLGLQPGSCTTEHCGPSLCPSGNLPCRIETSVVPFNIGVHFGQNTKETSPDDNLGMCLTYEQLPCSD